MSEKTLFSYISYEMSEKFQDYGFHYDDHNYINVFRWMWTDLRVHPHIVSFSGDDSTLITFKIHGKPHNMTATSFDEAIIKSVEFLYDNISDVA